MSAVDADSNGGPPAASDRGSGFRTLCSYSPLRHLSVVDHVVRQAVATARDCRACAASP